MKMTQPTQSTQQTQQTLQTQKTQGTPRPSPKVLAAIPCFNEQQFIADVVTRARKYVDRVIVIDDGSTDDTAKVARAAGAEVIKHETRKGAGAATRTGFQAAKRSNANILVTLDGDGQHNPDDIPRLLAPIRSNEADLVIGSRFLPPKQSAVSSPQSTANTPDSGLRTLNSQLGTNIPRYRKFGIDVITWLYNLGSEVKVSDSQSCFRAHSRRLIDAINITEDGFGFSVQVLIQARRKGCAIKEVPISCLYHSQGSSLNPVVHGLGVAFTVIKLRLLRR